MEQNELQRTLMAILFAAGEPVSVQRLAQTLERDPDEIRRETRQLMDALSFHRSGIRIVQLEDAFQMCSAAEQAEFVSRTLETRKPPKLSQSQLETLTVIAYYQPATKAYVEQIRGVDSAYSVSALLTKKADLRGGAAERARAAYPVSDDAGFPARVRAGIAGRAAGDRQDAASVAAAAAHRGGADYRRACGRGNKRR